MQLASYLSSSCYLTLSNPIFLPPAFSPALIYFGLERGWWITCPYYMRKSVGQAPTAKRENKRNKKKVSDVFRHGAEQENHNVGRGPTLDRKGLNPTTKATDSCFSDSLARLRLQSELHIRSLFYPFLLY
jgi:hypothetical protein